MDNFNSNDNMNFSHYEKKRKYAGVLCAVSAFVVLTCAAILIADSIRHSPNKKPIVQESTSENRGDPETTSQETSQQFDTDATDTEVSESDTDSETEPPPKEYEYITDVSAYLHYIDTKDKQYLILANRSYALGEDYIPDDLVSMSANANRKLRKCANKAFEAMYAEMKALGMDDCAVVASAYRSFDTQYKLYNKYLAQERESHPDYTEAQITALVDSYSARPGTSDHQTGLTIDFYPVSSKFEQTKTFQFMMENGYKFGFILRFPEGKTDITGYMYESWHWRFVGREAATYIYENGVTLEEYLEIVD